MVHSRWIWIHSKHHDLDLMDVMFSVVSHMLDVGVVVGGVDDDDVVVGGISWVSCFYCFSYACCWGRC